MSRRFKAAVVGCGRSGSLFDLDDKNKRMRSHSGAYKTHKKIELIGICDSDENKLLKSSKFWKIDNTYSNYKEMITENEIEILTDDTTISTELKNEFLSQSLDSVELNIDHSRYENFTKFSSVEKRIRNFRLKLEQIELINVTEEGEVALGYKSFF